MGIFSAFGQLFQQPQTNGVNDYSKRKLGGILGAIASGIAPQAYASGRDMYENRTIGGISDPNEKIRAAQQMGRYDLLDKIQQYQEAQRKTNYNNAMIKAAQGYRGYSQQPATQQQPMMQPQAQQQGITPQMEAQAAQSMPMVGFENQAPAAGQQQPNNDSYVTVTGHNQKPAPAPHFAQKSNPYEQADYLDYMAKVALQNGGFVEYQQYTTEAQKARQDAMTNYNQGVAANLAPALTVKDDPSTPNYNEADAAFDQSMNMMPYALPEEWQRLLSDPQTRVQAAKMLLGMGDPKHAASTAIDTQGSYDQFRPYQFRDMGADVLALDPRTGKKVASYTKSASPDAILSANVRQKVAAMQIASAQKIAQIRASMTMSEGDKNRAIRHETNAANLRIAALTGKVSIDNSYSDESELEQ